MSNADGSNPQKLTNMNGPLTGNARWSPDGKEIVFDSRAGGIYLLNPKTLQSKQFCIGAQPRWSRNGKWIYFTGPGAEVWKTPREGCNPVPVTHGGGFIAQESPDGKYVYYSKGVPVSLWRMTLGGAQEKIAENLSYSTNFYVTAEGVYFITRHGQPRKASLRFFDAHTSQTTLLLETGKSWGFGISVNGREILYSVVEDYGSGDLMYLDRVP
jgi:Tol biopolymer transport system component